MIFGMCIGCINEVMTPCLKERSMCDRMKIERKMTSESPNSSLGCNVFSVYQYY